MLKRPLFHERVKPRYRDEIGKEHMRDQRRHHDIKRMLKEPLAYQRETQRGGSELAASSRISVNPALDPPENMIEKNRVGTGPTAPNPAKDRSDNEQQKSEAADCKKQNPKILRHQC